MNGNTRLPTMATLLALSGCCSLIYQTVWLREFRLMVGASTLSSAAVLAVFMGGLGLGGFLFGARVEKSPRPLALYGTLELVVAASAAVSPFVLMALRALYLAAGGAATLGVFATPLRLLVTAVAIGVPVVCMGGTLPAAARAVTRDDDSGRSATAWLYGINTCGAVVGALAATFFLLEVYGSRTTLWLAALVNAGVALVARGLARRSPEMPPAPAPTTTMSKPPTLLRIAAFASGFVFLLAEIVWYRVASPLLGGSTYSFGMVLAVALAGIGVGGALYALVSPQKPTFAMLSATFLVGGVLLAIPLAAGDALALLTFHLREWGAPKFSTLAVSWALVTAFLVFPFALLCGFQFPLLIALRGRAADHVGRDAGEIYAANTLGSIGGSLLGGFLILPAVGAVGTWRGAALALVVVGAALGVAQRSRASIVAVVAAVVACVVVVNVDGPSAVWRHQAIGAGRATLAAKTANELASVTSEAQRVLYEREGRESVLGVTNNMGFSPLVNGKSDGNSLLDAPTAVGSALLPALLHGKVKTGFVIGLGTGQTAGWLGEVPGVESVDVVEIEPAFVEFAELCKDSNADVVHHKKVNTIIGDGREVLLTSKKSYDLILSEPSNPYRSGLASFYSTEFYAGVKAHLNDGGSFGQWMQGYEVGTDAVATVAATLKSQFKEVTLWQLAPGDLLFIATDRHQVVDAASVRALLAQEPMTTAFRALFTVKTLEDFLGLLVGNAAVVDAIAGPVDVINTDDNNALEYMFARSVGREGLQLRNLLLATSSGLKADRLEVVNGTVDDAAWGRARFHSAALEGNLPNIAADVVGPAMARWGNGDIAGAAPLFQQTPPRDALERLAAAEARAHVAGPGADLDDALAAVVADGFVAEAAVIRAQAAITAGDLAGLRAAAKAAADALRVERFPVVGLCARLFLRLDASGVKDNVVADAFVEPFINSSFHRARLNFILSARTAHQPGADCVTVLDQWGPRPPWTRPALFWRAACFAEFAKDRAAAAADDVAAFDAGRERGLALAAPDATAN